ncbi:hypothetical protein M5689_000930 [Euphorbia peplus]|nr:hypothetical protein M5689_000930 [Euphorbia peplus]
MLKRRIIRNKEVRATHVTKKLSKKDVTKVKCSLCGKEGNNKRHHSTSKEAKVQTTQNSRNKEDGDNPIMARMDLQVPTNDNCNEREYTENQLFEVPLHTTNMSTCFERPIKVQDGRESSFNIKKNMRFPLKLAK